MGTVILHCVVKDGQYVEMRSIWSELDQYFIGCRELVIFCNLGFPGEVKSQM